MHQSRHDANSYQRVEVITGRRRRRDWSEEEKARIVAESADPEVNISEVARRNGVSRGLLNVWRRKARHASSDGSRSCRSDRRRTSRRRGAKEQPRVVATSAARIEVANRRRDGARALGVDVATLERVSGGGEVDAVISFGSEVRVFVATQPIDFRKAYMASSHWWRRVGRQSL